MREASRPAGRGAGVLTLAIALVACWPTGAEPADAPPGTKTLGSLWPVRSAHQFHQALKPGIGFSFEYDGRRVGPETPAGWQANRQKRGETVETAFRHPSGLVAIRKLRTFRDLDAVEYTLEFRNESASESPALAGVRTLDVVFDGEVVEETSVVHSGGGRADSAFPPKDFAVVRTRLGSKPPAKDRLTLSSEGGLPSSVNLPFFFVQNKAQDAGIYVGVGWSGSWEATLRADLDDGTISVRAGMPDLRVKLRPGEEISGPRILLGCFRGPLSDGTNALRRVIRDHYAPLVGGQPLVAPVLYTTWFDIGAELDEALFRTLVDQAAEIGQEIFLLDAGWYKGVPATRYGDMRATWNAISHPLGNWELGEERSRFPSGLPALADYVRSQGMQFGLWFELERVGPKSLLATRHPDWVTLIPNRSWGLADFGKREVQDYFCKILDRYITSLDLAYIRWDSNVENFPPYWALGDEPGRQGITQIRHLEGLHRVEEHVRMNYPDVILESCAGGGTRIDLATLQRRHTIWISDQTMDPHIVRFHLEGLNQFLPGAGQLVAFAPRPNTYRQPGFVFSDVAYQSRFGGAFGSAGRLHEWPRAMKGQMRKHVDVFKQIRRFLSDDFYLLAPQSRTLESWSAWQFHDPTAGEGFVQAFRIRSKDETKRLALRALDAGSSYRFTDPYTGDTFEAHGATLASEGLELNLPPMSSQVFVYRKSR